MSVTSSIAAQAKTVTAAGAAGRVPNSMLVWLALVGYWVLARFIVGFLAPINVGIIAREFSWSNITLYGVLGLMGVWLSERTGFPRALDARVSNRWRFAIPLVVGAAFGMAAIVIDLLTQGTKFIEMQTGDASFNVYFPASLFVYTGGVVLIEAFLHLLPVPLFLFVISNIILRHRAQEKVFWVLTLSFSLMEPVLNSGNILFANPTAAAFNQWLAVGLPVFVLTYVLNLTQMIMFRRYGFLASVSLRLAEYAIWHIAYGSLMYPVLFR